MEARQSLQANPGSAPACVAVLFSGGKDSTYVACIVMQRDWDVRSLIAIRPAAEDSMLAHVPILHLTPLPADALSLLLLEEAAAMGQDGELATLRRTFSRADVDGIVVGAVAADYQHSRINRVADELGLNVYAPWWRHDTSRLLPEYLTSGLRIVFSRRWRFRCSLSTRQ